LKKLVLASGSPRRREILKEAGLEFTVARSGYEEDLSLQMSPHDLAMHLSAGKARDVAARHMDALVIAADTFIVLEGRILGKPGTADEAEQMLRAMSGKEHSVITGFTVLDSESKREVSRWVETRVRFREISDDEITSYVETGEPLDKAGAYGIQQRGAALVERVEGDYLNVVGLPLEELKKVLAGFGFEFHVSGPEETEKSRNGKRS